MAHGHRVLPLRSPALELGDQELGRTCVLRVLVPGIGKVGFDTAGSELLPKSQAHDRRVSWIALLLAHSGGLVLGRVIKEHGWIPRSGVLVGRVLPDPGQDLVAMVVERL